MEVNSIISALCGAEFREVKLLSECIVNDEREICLTVRVRCHGSADRQNRIAAKDYIAT